MSYPLDASANIADGSRSAPHVNPVTVSLRVNIDVSGNVNVFNQAATTVYNVVDCDIALPVSTLYASSSSAAFEFWEPSGAQRGDISACVMGAGSSSYASAGLHAASGNGSLGDLKTNLRSIIDGGMDASAAAPFAAYAGTSNYTRYANFGELALGAHAAYLFGHPQATVAIDNDAALVNYFKDGDAAGTTPSAATANIGNELATLIRGLSDAEVRTIVREVLRQDPVRMADADNSERPTNVHQGLVFATGDVVYVSVTISPPSITLGGDSNSAARSALATPLGALPTLSHSFPTDGAQYTLRITLA